MDLEPQNKINVAENHIVSCETAGIYAQGRASRPVFKGNKIKYCRCVGIITFLDVDASIVSNELIINDCGIEILNNKSRVIDNSIEKSHEDGIKIVGYDKNTRSTPYIWKNRIFSCGYNGVLCLGEFCEPDVRGNIIESNRKAGIKLTEFSCA